MRVLLEWRRHRRCGPAVSAEGQRGEHVCEPLLEVPTAPDGQTMLLLAAAAGGEVAVRYLRDQGARLDATDRRGRTALHYAAMGGHAALSRQLGGWVRERKRGGGGGARGAGGGERESESCRCLAPCLQLASIRRRRQHHSTPPAVWAPAADTTAAWCVAGRCRRC
jgi:hypothetical protein